MTNETFAKGDVVWLRSGGPALTVVNVRVDTEDVFVVWMDWNGTLQRGDFSPDVLTHKVEAQ